MAEKLQDVLSAIVERLEAGVAPWRQPWANGAEPSRPLRADGQPFTGSNAMLLAMFSSARGCASPYWLTYKQCLALNAQVRKGAKGAPAILYKTRVVDGDEERDERTLRYLQSYVVFNADDVDGLPDSFRTAPPVDLDMRARAQDATLAAVPADLRHGGGAAYYNRGSDFVQMPPIEAFESVDDYKSTLAHELGHWTGAETRLNRVFGSRFGDADYAFEELIAEGISLLLGMEIGVRPDMRECHASYMAVWVKLLKDRPNALVEAFGKAQKAVDYLLSFSQAASAQDCSEDVAGKLAA